MLPFGGEPLLARLAPAAALATGVTGPPWLRRSGGGQSWQGSPCGADVPLTSDSAPQRARPPLPPTSIDGAGSTHVASLDVRACGTQAPRELIRRHHRPSNRDAQARARRTTGRSCVTAPARTTVPACRRTITRARSRSGTWGSRATPRNKAGHNRLGGPPRPWSKSQERLRGHSANFQAGSLGSSTGIYITGWADAGAERA